MQFRNLSGIFNETFGVSRGKLEGLLNHWFFHNFRWFHIPTAGQGVDKTGLLTSAVLKERDGVVFLRQVGWLEGEFVFEAPVN
jgi:hypothetical protein